MTNWLEISISSVQANRHLSGRHPLGAERILKEIAGRAAAKAGVSAPEADIEVKVA
jgi:hypothetical protein